MKVYIVNVNNCEAYSDYYEGNRGVYLTYQDAVDAMTELGFDPSTKTKVIPWYDFENEKDWFESGWYDREAYRIEEWELPERTCKKLPATTDNTCVVRNGYFEMEFGYWRCSECGAECFEGAKFCMNCGAKVVE